MTTGGWKDTLQLTSEPQPWAFQYTAAFCPPCPANTQRQQLYPKLPPRTFARSAALRHRRPHIDGRFESIDHRDCRQMQLQFGEICRFSRMTKIFLIRRTRVAVHSHVTQTNAHPNDTLVPPKYPRRLDGDCALIPCTSSRSNPACDARDAHTL